MRLIQQFIWVFAMTAVAILFIDSLVRISGH